MGTHTHKCVLYIYIHIYIYSDIYIYIYIYIHYIYDHIYIYIYMICTVYISGQADHMTMFRILFNITMFNIPWSWESFDALPSFRTRISIELVTCQGRNLGRSSASKMVGHHGCLYFVTAWWFGTWLLFSISYMGCHPNPIDFHSIIFQDGYCTTKQINIT